MGSLLGPDEGKVENVRLKILHSELIVSQSGNFTFIVEQRFVSHHGVNGEEEGGEDGDEAAE